MNKNKNQDALTAIKDGKKQQDIKKIMNRLFVSCKENNLEGTKNILENNRGLPLNTTLDEHDNTILTCACSTGIYQMVLLLLNHGATKGVEKCYGNSYLFKGSESKGKEILEIYYELSYKNLVGDRTLRKINDEYYEINGK